MTFQVQEKSISTNSITYNRKEIGKVLYFKSYLTPYYGPFLEPYIAVRENSFLYDAEFVVFT
jgi:hypothetical protein